MRRESDCWLAICLLATILPACFQSLGRVAAAAEYSPAELEEGFLSHRAKMKSGKVVIIQFLNGKETRNELVFSEGGYRGDSFLESGEGTGTYRRSVAFPSSGKSLFYSTETFNGGGDVVASIRMDSTRQRLLTLPDPRIIGSRPLRSDLLVHFSINSLVGNELWVALDTPEEVVEGGANVWRVDYAGHGVSASAWYDPSRDFNIVRMAIQEQELLDEFQCKLQRVEGFGWFIDQLEYTRQESGSVTIKETLQFRDLEINVSVPDNVFTLAGMGVPDGHIVFDRTVPGALVKKTLANGELVDFPKLPIQRVTNSDAISGQSGWGKILVSLGIGLGLLAIYFIARGVENGTGVDSITSKHFKTTALPKHSHH